MLKGNEYIMNSTVKIEKDGNLPWTIRYFSNMQLYSFWNLVLSHGGQGRGWGQQIRGIYGIQLS
jgi:hypothetical protein